MFYYIGCVHTLQSPALLHPASVTVATGCAACVLLLLCSETSQDVYNLHLPLQTFAADVCNLHVEECMAVVLMPFVQGYDYCLTSNN